MMGRWPGTRSPSDLVRSAPGAWHIAGVAQEVQACLRPWYCKGRHFQWVNLAFNWPADQEGTWVVDLETHRIFVNGFQFIFLGRAIKQTGWRVQYAMTKATVRVKMLQGKVGRAICSEPKRRYRLSAFLFRGLQILKTFIDVYTTPQGTRYNARRSRGIRL